MNKIISLILISGLFIACGSPYGEPIDNSQHAQDDDSQEQLTDAGTKLTAPSKSLDSR